MIRWFTVLFLIFSAAIVAAQNTVTPQIGGGLGYGFDGGVSFAGGPTVCGGYLGPGDIAGGAKIAYAIRAWSASTCGARFANITVTGVSADMFTSSTTGDLVPQTINGSVCPNASTTLCVLTKWYDQTLSNACTGSCDSVKTGTEQLGVLTTTCPAPLTKCIVFPTSTATYNQVAAAFTPASTLTVSAFINYTFGGPGNGVYVGGFEGSGGGAALGHGGLANQSSYSCDGTNFISSSSTSDGSWYSQGLVCGTSTSQLFINGTGQGSNALTPNLSTSQPFVGGIFASGPTIYETEVGIWNSDVTGLLASLDTNQRNYYGFAPVTSAQNYFFNSTTGIDTNNCKFASGTAPNGPCLTIPRANGLQNFGGGSLTFTGSFTGCLVQSQGNVTNPAAGTITINLTGSTLTSNCPGSNSATLGPKSVALICDSINCTVNGGTIRGSGSTLGTATQFGMICQNSSGGSTYTCNFNNNDVSGFGVVAASGVVDIGGEMWISGFTEGASGFPNGVCGNVIANVTNPTLHGATVTSFDNAGAIGSGCGNTVATTYKGGLIFDLGAINDGGIFGAGAGIVLVGGGAGSNPSITFTLAHDNGANNHNCGGAAGLWTAGATTPLMQFDEAYNITEISYSGPNCDGVGFDWDQSGSTPTTSGLGQYLYSHNNAGPGYLIFTANTNNVFRYSISENDQLKTRDFASNDGGGVFAPQNAIGLFAAYNNTIFLTGAGLSASNPPSCLSAGFSGVGNGLWANNICYNAVTNSGGVTYMLMGGGVSGTNFINMVNNDYFNAAGGTLTFAFQWNNNASVTTTYATLAALQAGTGQEANSITSNPSTGTWTAFGNLTWTPSTQSPTWPPSGGPTTYSTVSVAVKSAGANLVSAFPTWFTGAWPATTAGTRDYYANTIPGTGPCYNMGAYGLCP